jgi:diguanylate cyclase (GGDEF)-like protein/PAS domain S-box-containing protein
MTLFADRPAGSDVEVAQAVGDARRLRAILRLAGDAFVGMNGDGTITEWNRAAEAVFGWTRDEALGRSVAELIVPERFRHAHDAGVARYLATGQGRVLGVPVQTQGVRKDGTEVQIELTRWALEGATEPEFYAFVRDITSRLDAEYAATHDPLTGLANTSRLVQQIEGLLAENSAPGVRPTLILLDIDRFKRVNDEIGRTAGDEVLRRIAQRLSEVAAEFAPGQELVARLSGDQFGVLLGDAAAAQGISVLADALMEAVCEVIQTATRAVRATCSAGVSSATGVREWDVELIMRGAQTALRQAQRAAGNSLAIFDERLQQRDAQRKSREHELAIAIEKGHLEVFYQPIFALGSGALAGAEALVRWRHPQLGLLAPNLFIGVAEETGLIVPLGRWVLHEVCRQLAAWQQVPALADLRVSVNFSAHQFADSDPVADVTDAIARAGVVRGGERLTVEVTESVLIGRPEEVAADLAGLRKIGVNIAIDDFGTGFSSLSYLKQLPLDVLKVDKSFVDGLPHSRPDRAIVISTIALAHELGFAVVAEGVETEEQRESLQRHGADYVQGYLMARPQPADEFERMFAVGGD